MRPLVLWLILGSFTFLPGPVRASPDPDCLEQAEAWLKAAEDSESTDRQGARATVSIAYSQLYANGGECDRLGSEIHDNVEAPGSSLPLVLVAIAIGLFAVKRW